MILKCLSCWETKYKKLIETKFSLEAGRDTAYVWGNWQQSVHSGWSQSVEFLSFYVWVSCTRTHAQVKQFSPSDGFILLK